MNWQKKQLLSLSMCFVILCTIMGATSVSAATDEEEPVWQLSMKMELSATEIERGDSLLVNVTTNLPSDVINKTTGIIESKQVPVLVAFTFVRTGDVIKEVKGITHNGSFSYRFTANTTNSFGEYTAWVIIENISGTMSFWVVPKLIDTYNQNLQIIENQEADKVRDEWRNMFDILVIIIVCVGLLFAYWMWRMPKLTKDDIKDWILTHGDSTLWEKIDGDMRDFDRARYYIANFPATATKEKNLERLDVKITAAARLSKRFARKIEKMKMEEEKQIAKRKRAEEFKNDMDNLVVTGKSMYDKLDKTIDEDIENNRRRMTAKMSDPSRENIRELPRHGLASKQERKF